MRKKYKLNKKLISNTIVGVILLFFAFIVLISSHTKNDRESQTGNLSSELKTRSEPDIVEDISDASEMGYEIESSDDEAESKEKLINFDTKYPFFIRVNRAENFATIYGMDHDNSYTIPYKTFVCSTGKNPEDTPLGIFDISEKYRWCQMVDYTFSQYAIRIYGHIMLHSVPYEKMSRDTLEYKEYNKLGKPASLGCVRFRVKDIKWIYEHCSLGTEVEIYEQKNEIPEIPLKKIRKIKKTSKNKGWDPTDPDKNNPWKKKKNK